MSKKIIVALDFESKTHALDFIDRIDPDLCRLKIGKELFVASGPQLVTDLVGRGFDIFLDLKFHDIPNTVARAVSQAADLGIWMLNVHASGGLLMLEAAQQALEPFGGDRPILIAVTVLTSLGEDDLKQLGISFSPAGQVKRLALLARDARLDGIVCSAAETKLLRHSLPKNFIIVTPGIRRPEDASNDQKRVIGPSEAIRNGSNYLVVGRPITRAENPNEMLKEFNSAAATAG